MTWEKFYDSYSLWADSTISSRISQISDLEDADPAEIAYCCQCIDESLACRLLRKALRAGVRFTREQAEELSLLVSDRELLKAIVSGASGSCSKENLEKLSSSNVSSEKKQSGRKGLFFFLGALGEGRSSKSFFGGSGRSRHRPGGAGKSGSMSGSAGRPGSLSGFRVGDHVRVKYRGQEGTIVDINGSLIMVSLDDGGYVDSYYASQLEKAW